MSSIETESFIYETDRLKFRGLCRSDIEGPYFHWLNDQEVCRYSTHGVFPSTLDKLSAYLDSLQTTDVHLVWAIIEKERGRHIGNITLQYINSVHMFAALSILIGDKSCWGKVMLKKHRVC